MTAADVGDPRARMQLRLDALERRDPGAHQVRVVARPEEPLGALEQAVMVLVPADALAAAERLADLRPVVHGRRDELEGSGERRRAVVLRQHERVLRRQRVATGLAVVADVPARRLRVQPLADVPLGRCGRVGELGRGHRAGAVHRAVEPELVADHHERGVQCRTELAHELPHELLQLRVVDRLCRHDLPPSSSGRGERRDTPSMHRESIVI